MNTREVWQIRQICLLNSRKSGKHLEVFCVALTYPLGLNIKIHLESHSRTAYAVTVFPLPALKLVQNKLQEWLLQICECWLLQNHSVRTAAVSYWQEREHQLQSNELQLSRSVKITCSAKHYKIWYHYQLHSRSWLGFVVDTQHILKKSAKILLHKNLFFENHSAKNPCRFYVK